jgi:hypothetical protein
MMADYMAEKTKEVIFSARGIKKAQILFQMIPDCAGIEFLNSNIQCFEFLS